MTRKITRAVGRIKQGLQDKLYLGNLEAKREWGYAPDSVVATGETHRVRDFAVAAFAHAGLEWEEHTVVDKRSIRPTEVDMLLGDPTKAREQLGWEATVKFEELVGIMVDSGV